MRTGLQCIMILSLLMAGTTGCSHAQGRDTAAPSAAPAAVQAATPVTAGQERAAGEYLVTLANGVDAKIISDVYGRFGIKGVHNMGAGIFHLILSEDPGPEKMEGLRKQDGRIKAIQPNYIYRAN